MIKRKDYVIKVTEQMQTNAKAVLAGHGLKGNVLALIAKRPDVIAKLAVLAYSSRIAAKGGKALQKKANFKITAYANFANFNFQARKDIEAFMGKLPEADQATFSNADNIITLLVMNSKPSGNVEADIVNGSSVALPFDKSVMKQYKFGTGVYICIMWGDSWIMPREEKLAKSKAKTNARIASRMTPARTRALLVSKTNAAKAELKSEAILLKNKANILGGSLEQFNDLAAAVGADGSDPKAALAAIKAYNSTNKALLKSLDSGDLAFYNKAAKLYIKGDTAKANRILDEIGIPQLTELVRGGNMVSTDKIVAERKKALNAKVREISAANEELLAKVEASTDSKFRADTNFKIRANVAKIKELRARAASFGELTSVTSIKSKAKMLADVNEEIAKNIGKGLSVQAALQKALAGLPVEEDVKQQVRQQVIEGVAQGTPMQYAVQQAIQNIAPQQANDVEEAEELADDLGLDLDEPGDTALSGSKSIQEILANL